MSIARRLARQLASPSGLSGRLLGNAMDMVNRKPLQLAVDLLAPRANEDVLDAGCGTGAAMAEIAARAPCRITGIDRSETMIAAARRRLGSRARYSLSPIDALRSDDGTYDAVLALNVLYFETPDHAMLRALHRVLRPGGRIVAYATPRDSMRDWSFPREGLHRLFDAQDLRTAFVDAGFAQAQVEVHEVPVTRSVKGLLVRAWR